MCYMYIVYMYYMNIYIYVYIYCMCIYMYTLFHIYQHNLQRQCVNMYVCISKYMPITYLSSTGILLWVTWGFMYLLCEHVDPVKVSVHSPHA